MAHLLSSCSAVYLLAITSKHTSTTRKSVHTMTHSGGTTRPVNQLILALLDRPREPVFVRKGANEISFDVPESAKVRIIAVAVTTLYI